MRTLAWGNTLFALFGAVEESGQRVVVRLTHCVELVVMTPCALDGQTEKRFAYYINLRIDFVPALLHRIDRHEVHFVHEQYASCGRRDILFTVYARPLLLGWQQVSSDVFKHESVVRQVVVQRVNNVVAILPSVGSFLIADVSFRLRIVHDVEPMTSPLLSKSRAV